MGQIIRAQCVSCDYCKNLFVGGGRSDCDAETLLNALPEPERETLAAALARGASAAIARRGVQCTRCRSLYSLPVVEYAEEGRKETLYGRCPRCGGAAYMDLGGRNRLVKRCPECGGDLTLTLDGHWD